LHDDPTILTRGRYYRAGPDAPCVPSATYLASREYFRNSKELPYGEWGGRQQPDNGVPPHLLPRGQVIGGTCLENLIPTGGPAGTPAINRGRCVHLPTWELCGNVPLFTNFSLAYQPAAGPGSIIYYRNVPNYLTKDTGEGEWSGAVDGLENAVSRVRVTETDGGLLDFRFAICDNTPPPPPVLLCCSGTFPYSFKRSLTVQAIELPVTLLWEVFVGDIEFVWQPGLGIFRAAFTCGGVDYLCDVFIYSGSSCQASVAIYAADFSFDVWSDSFCVVTCPPGTWINGLRRDIDIGTTIEFCGQTVTGGVPTKATKAIFGPIH